MAQTSTVRYVIIGNDKVGKTSILYRLSNSKVPPIEDFPNFSENQVLNGEYDMLRDHHLLNMEHSGQKYDVSFQDTTYETRRLRPLIYVDMNLVMICFSVVDMQSFHDIESSWIEEINHFFFHGVPKILIGNKIDLRTHRASTEEAKTKKSNLPPQFWGKGDNDPVDEGRPVAREEGMRLAKAINADAYVECSAVTEEGMSDVHNAIQNTLELARRHAAYQPRCTKGRCIIL